MFLQETTSTNPIKNKGEESIHKNENSKQAAHPKKSQGLYLSVFAALIEAMNAGQQAVIGYSLQLKVNANLQEKLNKDNMGLNYTQIPTGKNIGVATINRVQDKNQQVTKERQDLLNLLSTARQVGQIEMTEASTGVNDVQWDASENESYIKTLGNVVQMINQMIKRSQ